MIRLKDILNELEVGDELFADDDEMFKDPYDDLFGKDKCMMVRQSQTLMRKIVYS